MYLLIIITIVSVLTDGALLDPSDSFEKVDIRMPSVLPGQGEQYVCRSMKIESPNEKNIVAFFPNASMYNVHHMMLYGCSEPGMWDDVWDCREMYKLSANSPSKFASGRVCNNYQSQRILYAWAKDAPELNLPADVGFKVGGNTKIQYLVLQVHYLHTLNAPDSSGLSVVTTTKRLPKTAGVLFLASDGVLRANSVEKFEITCRINENIILHPFAFRVHTHAHGRLVSSYLIRNKQWSLIGKKNPQLPQMFYAVSDANMIITANDIIAARCTMVNDDNRDVFIGASADDEMCNYYLMYWVDGDRTMFSNQCLSSGPPRYYWSQELSNVPDVDASSDNK